MTLAELRAQLAALDLPDGTPVIPSKDGEGGGFSPLDEVETARCLAESSWAGERRDIEDAEADGAAPTVFLWPTN